MEESYEDDEGEPVVKDQTEAIVDAVKELVREGPGDILVFLPGEREIRDTADVLGKVSSPGPGRWTRSRWCRCSRGCRRAEQHKVFERHSNRRVVLATNVAETSLTVPGIRYVVDAGYARISRYSARTKVQRLPIEPISQASANQRKGRCGRVEAGVAIRLYSEEDFESRPEFTDPEILRTNLASVILQMTALGLGDVARFPFVDPPDSAQRQGRRPAARGARRARARASPAARGGGSPAHPARTPARGAAARPPAGPDGGRGRQARLPARGARHRGGAVHPGPARAAVGGADPGRPEARPVPRRDLGLPHPAQPVALREDPAARAQLERVPADVPRGVPQLPAHPRVAGARVAAAPGRQAAQARRAANPRTSRTATASTRRCCPACSRTSACATRSGATTSAPATRGSRSSRAPGCSRSSRSS